jgi:hypothetical protein
MLLVMETTALFSQINSNDTKCTQLCLITKDRIELFLPGLWDELFKTSSKSSNKEEIVAVAAEVVETQQQEIQIQQLNETEPHQPVNLIIIRKKSIILFCF